MASPLVRAAKGEWGVAAGPSMHLTNHGCDWLTPDCSGSVAYAGPAFGGVGEVTYGIGHDWDVGLRLHSFYQEVLFLDQTLAEQHLVKHLLD